MKHKLFKSIGSSAAVLAAGIFVTSFSGGCTDTSAKRVETGGPETIRTVDQIDDQDWSEAAAKMTRKMMSQDDLFPTKASGGKYILAIGRVINSTSRVNADTDLLTKKIRVVLNESGKVVTQSTDAENQAQAKLNNFENDKPPEKPDYRLTGKMLESRAKAGDINQTTYTFQLSLTDQAGHDIYEAEEQITKIGSHNAVGL